MTDFRGIYAVTITPFKEDGGIDYDLAGKHLNWLLDSGVHGVLPIGATGEFAALSFEERKQYAEFIMKEVAGRVPVIVGAVSQDVTVSLAVADHAASIGAAAVMILPPPGIFPSQEEIFAFYKFISGEVKVPVMVYNNPHSAGVDIEPETLARIAKLPNMALLKESTGDIKRLTRAVDELKGDLTIFCGCENIAYESFVMGASGWVCVLANVAPAMAVELYDLIVNKGDLVKARELNGKLLPYLRLLEDSGELWQVLKYTLQKSGMKPCALRRPRLAISEETKKLVDEVLAKQTYK